MTTAIIYPFPGANIPETGAIPDQAIDRLHGKAFRALEDEIAKLDCWADIATDYAMTADSNPTPRNCELAAFLAEHVRRRILMLRTNYQNLWRGDPLVDEEHPRA